MQRMKFVDQVKKTAKNTSTLKLTDKVDEESGVKLSDSMVSDRDPNKSTNLPKENKRKNAVLTQTKRNEIFM